MAGESKLMSHSFNAAADLSAKQYCFMKLSASKTVNTCGAGEAGIGVLQNDPDAAGKPAEVMLYGITNVIAGGTVAYNAALKSDSAGHAVSTTTDDELYMAIALEAAVDNDVFSALLIGGYATYSGSGDD